MELRQLRYLLNVLEHGGFNRAADASYVTQPALSKSMKSLEDELGVELLDRSGRQVVPTAFGKILARAAHLVDGELKRAIKEINSLAERGSGKLVVAGGVVMRYLLPPTLELLRRELPEIEIVVVEALAVSALTALARGDVDIAICPPAIDEIPSGICSEHLLHDSIAVVVHARHPVLKLANVAMADLQHYGWVMPGKEEKERQVLERALFAAGLPPPRVAVETSSTALIAQLLESQELLAYLPTVALKGDPGLQSLRAVAVRSPWSERDLHVFWRDASTTLPSVQRFLTCVRQAAQNIRVEVSQ